MPCAAAQTVPSYSAARTTQTLQIDGVPSEESWAQAQPIENFTQQDPDTGQPATERTIVRVLYDDAAVYFAAWLYDSGPVTARLARRDSFLPADWFAVYLDTHHDHRTARMFRVNPYGVQRDSLVEENDEEDRSWDAVWESAAAFIDGGWTVEIRIPYSQLRFADAPAHTWGLNFHREVARNNEYSRLVHVPRNESGFVNRFAHLTGIEGITPPRRLEILPYAVSRLRLDGDTDPLDPLTKGAERREDAGVDLEYGLSSNLTLTLTLNPDFGQVEADPAEVNLSQFELFFEERRPFFLEGADLFTFTGTDLFYSRRIGRLPQGSPEGSYDYLRMPAQTTILGAAKLSGKTANGWSIGVLDAVTREETATLMLDGIRRSSVVEPQTNYFAGRLSRDFGDDVRVGAILTSVNRSNPDHLDYLHDTAWTGGIDGYRWFGQRDYVLRWAALGSRVTGSPNAIERTQRAPAHYYQGPDANHIELDPSRTSLTGWGADVLFEKTTGKWRFGARTNAHSPGLEINDIGFRSRSDTMNVALSGTWLDPEPRGMFRSRSSTVAKASRFNFDGDHTLDRWFGSGQVRFLNYWSAEYSWAHDAPYLDDRLTRGGPLAIFPQTSRLSIGFSTDFRRPWVFGLTLSADQGDMDRYLRAAELEVSWHPRSNITLEFEPSYASWRDPLQFVTRVSDSTAAATFGARYVFGAVERREINLATRLDWALTRSLTVQLYLQPLISSGAYEEFHELARPSSLDYRGYEEIAFDPAVNRYTIDPDSGGPAGSFSFSNPDFNLRSLRGNLVTRWEFRPGSSLYFVWSQDRSEEAIAGDFDFSRDFRALSSLPEDDVFLVKVSYWFGL